MSAPVDSSPYDGQPVALPPVVYVPTVVQSDGAHLALSQLADGRTALLVYGALDRLVDAMGNDQSWALVTLLELTQLRRESPFDAILLDVPAIIEAIA